MWNEFEKDVMKTPGGPEKRGQDQTPFRLRLQVYSGFKRMFKKILLGPNRPFALLELTWDHSILQKETQQVAS